MVPIIGWFLALPVGGDYGWPFGDFRKTPGTMFRPAGALPILSINATNGGDRSARVYAIRNAGKSLRSLDFVRLLVSGRGHAPAGPAAPAARCTALFDMQIPVARADFGNSDPALLGSRAEYRTKKNSSLVSFWTHHVDPSPNAPNGVYDNRSKLDAVDTRTVSIGEGNIADVRRTPSVGDDVYRIAVQDRRGYRTRDRQGGGSGLRRHRRAFATRAGATSRATTGSPKPGRRASSARALTPDGRPIQIAAASLAKGRFRTRVPNAYLSGDARYGNADLVFKF